jgi:alkylation response protein AidB-like acyl-CoA dehydrogenase
LLGQENKGFPIIMNSESPESPGNNFLKSILAKEMTDFNHERLWLACTALRMARVCIEDAYKYATVRETFGKRLLDNQVIRTKISTMARSVDSAYAWMEQLVYISDRAKRDGTDAKLGGVFANLKVLAGQTLERVNREAQQIMGGLGYSKTGRGARIEQISRDLRVMVVGGGSEEILAELAVNQEIKAAKSYASSKL